jgi:uncharacterized membrane protein YhhN
VPSSFVLLAAPALACVTLALLLWRGEWRRSTRDRWLYKPATSTLFLVAALAAGPDDRYDWLVLTALVLGAAGDVCLIPPGRAWFLAGLSAFLASHLAYLAAFATRADPLAADPAATLAILAMGSALVWYLWPHLGALRVPVLAYALAITAMLVAATAVFDASGLDTAFRWCVLGGATLFYLSDVSVARDRFVPRTGFANRAVGLPLYYAAQFLLAGSIAL